MLAKQGNRITKNVTLNKEMSNQLNEELKKLQIKGIKIPFSTLIDILIYEALEDVKKNKNIFKELYQKYEKEVLIPEKERKREKSLKKRREREKNYRREKWKEE